MKRDVDEEKAKFQAAKAQSRIIVNEVSRAGCFLGCLAHSHDCRMTEPHRHVTTRLRT